MTLRETIMIVKKKPPNLKWLFRSTPTTSCSSTPFHCIEEYFNNSLTSQLSSNLSLVRGNIFVSSKNITKIELEINIWIILINMILY